MSDYLIVKCGRCGEVWAFDYEPAACTCDDDRYSNDDLTRVYADNYKQALTRYRDHEARYPSVTEEP